MKSNKISEVIKNIELDKDYLIIGRNGSGKTYVLEEIIGRNMDTSYYINVYNREYEYEDLSKNSESKKFIGLKLNMQRNLKERLDKTAKRSDMLKLYKNNEESIISRDAIQHMNLLFQYSFKETVENFFSNTKKIQFKDNVKILGEEHPSISEGYQGIIRLICEVSLACEFKEIKNIFIDEIEKYIDYIHCYNLIKYLKSIASKNGKKLIISTHSPKIILGAKGFTIINIIPDGKKLKDRKVKFINSDILDSQIYIEEKLFCMDDIIGEKPKYDLVDIFLKLRKQESLTREEEEYLRNIDESSLNDDGKSIKLRIDESWKY